MPLLTSMEQPAGKGTLDVGELERFCQLVASRIASNRPVVSRVYETPQPGNHVSRDCAEAVPGVGLAGDHPEKSFYRGAHVPGREISAISQEVLDLLGIDPLTIGDNLVTAGVDLRALQPGDCLHVGAVVLARSIRAHRPCGKFRARTGDYAYFVAAAGFRGALFNVERGGTLCVGGAIIVI